MNFSNDTKISAGLVMYKIHNNTLYIALGCPSGPYVNKKHKYIWSIPKGGVIQDETMLECGKREFYEETGIYYPFTLKDNQFIDLQSVVQGSGKTVFGFGFRYDEWDGNFKSIEIDIEWPPKSNTIITIPEIAKLEWFDYYRAKNHMVRAQIQFFKRLQQILHVG